MNIHEKHSPSGASGNGNSGAQQQPPPPPPPPLPPPPLPPVSSGSLTPSASSDCQMIPNSLNAPPSSTAPSSVSSSSAPHTPIDNLNSVNNCGQSDLTSNGLPSTRPNVSTPSSVFNSSAPNTPMPCPSVGSDANITSPALNHQLDYGDQKMFNSGGCPVPPSQPPSAQSSQALANNAGGGGNNNNNNNPVLPPSPLNVPPPMCNEPPSKKANNGSKKHCNNRNNQSGSQFAANINVKCENNANASKNPINFPAPNSMSGMPCNGSHHNGAVSAFDSESSKSPSYKLPKPSVLTYFTRSLYFYMLYR